MAKYKSGTILSIGTNIVKIIAITIYNKKEHYYMENLNSNKLLEPTVAGIDALTTVRNITLIHILNKL